MLIFILLYLNETIPHNYVYKQKPDKNNKMHLFSVNNAPISYSVLWQEYEAILIHIA